MRACLLAFVAGCWWLQQQGALASWHGYVGAMAGVLVWALGWRFKGRVMAQSVQARGPRRSLCPLAMATVLALVLGAAWANWRAAVRMADWLPESLAGQNLVITGEVAGLPDVAAHGTRFLFAPDTAPATHGAYDALATPAAPGALGALLPEGRVPPRVLLTWRNPPIPLVPGQRWQLTVRLKRPRGLANPHGFDYAYWLLSEGIGATGHVRAARAGPMPGDGARIARWRAALRDRMHAAMPADARLGSVLVALAIGDQRGIAQADWEIFRRTGISHLVSISGLHITMLSGAVGGIVHWLWRHSFGLGRRLRRPLPLCWPARQAALVAAVATALAYGLIAGMQIPAMRTVAMLTVAAVALWSGRAPPATLVLTWAAAVAVVIDPWAVMAPGFWLSFGAVAVIFLAAARPEPAATARPATRRRRLSPEATPEAAPKRTGAHAMPSMSGGLPGQHGSASRASHDVARAAPRAPDSAVGGTSNDGPKRSHAHATASMSGGPKRAGAHAVARLFGGLLGAGGAANRKPHGAAARAARGVGSEAEAVAADDLAEEPSALQRRLLRWRAALVSAARVQWAVTIGLVPFSLLLFGQVSVVSAIANAVAIPIVSIVVTPLSLLGAVAPPPVAHLALTVAHQAMAWLADALAWLAAPAWAVWEAAQAGPLAMGLASIGVFLLLLPDGDRAMRAYGALLMAPMILASGTPVAQGEMRVTALDIGQGTAVLVETQAHALLYDTGPGYLSGTSAGAQVVVPYLRATGVRRLDRLIVSHEDADHAGGVRDIEAVVPIGRRDDDAMPAGDARGAETARLTGSAPGQVSLRDKGADHTRGVRDVETARLTGSAAGQVSLRDKGADHTGGVRDVETARLTGSALGQVHLRDKGADHAGGVRDVETARLTGSSLGQVSLRDKGADHTGGVRDVETARLTGSALGQVSLRDKGADHAGGVRDVETARLTGSALGQVSLRDKGADHTGGVRDVETARLTGSAPGQVFLRDKGADHTGGVRDVETARLTGSALGQVPLRDKGADHTGGVRDVETARLTGAPPGQAWMTRSWAPCEAGMAWVWDGVHFEFLHPPATQSGNPRVASNARSCVLRVATARRSVLLTGDIGVAEERAMVRRAEEEGAPLRADILVVPHHGSGTSSGAALLRAVAPEIAVFQLGYRNRYGHPRADVWARYEARDIKRYRTDETGAITIVTRGDAYDVTPYRQHVRRYWRDAPPAPR
ncbi:ComEC/Rec2 family competence protein [Cupriavidus pauculus]|uniref:ComEC/Rec2 family competence protein n=1 Tax=Cupriavidus pauculus TaxID=82633 RepID=UPI001CC3142A|nr:ComEC/Rec2 family competence protein [Cupriavidus pauculus]